MRPILEKKKNSGKFHSYGIKHCIGSIAAPKGKET
jgi:hypothetical protein